MNWYILFVLLFAAMFAFGVDAQVSLQKAAEYNTYNIRIYVDKQSDLTISLSTTEKCEDSSLVLIHLDDVFYLDTSGKLKIFLNPQSNIFL